MNITEATKIDQLILEKVQIALWQTFSESKIYLQNPQVRLSQLSNLADQCAFTLTGWLIGNKFPDRSEFDSIEYPDGWWQFLKFQHAPKWFVRRWPVKVKVIRYESARYRYHICPHWNRDFSHDGERLHFAYLQQPLNAYPPEKK